ncbi:hypothetical protein PHET_05715, partial [Paragonimus heterotremus]
MPCVNMQMNKSISIRWIILTYILLTWMHRNRAIPIGKDKEGKQPTLPTTNNQAYGTKWRREAQETGSEKGSNDGRHNLEGELGRKSDERRNTEDDEKVKEKKGVTREKESTDEGQDGSETMITQPDTASSTEENTSPNTEGGAEENSESSESVET